MRIGKRKIKTMKKKCTMIVTSLSICSLTACGAVLDLSGGGNEQGSILINADERGMRAFGDVLNGLVDNTKTPAGMESAHYKLRKEQTRARVLRFTKPTWRKKQ